MGTSTKIFFLIMTVSGAMRVSRFGTQKFFLIARNKDAKVADYLDVSRRIHWNVSFTQAIQDWELVSNIHGSFLGVFVCFQGGYSHIN